MPGMAALVSKAGKRAPASIVYGLAVATSVVTAKNGRARSSNIVCRANELRHQLGKARIREEVILGSLEHAHLRE